MTDNTPLKEFTPLKVLSQNSSVLNEILSDSKKDKEERKWTYPSPSKSSTPYPKKKSPNPNLNLKENLVLASNEDESIADENADPSPSPIKSNKTKEKGGDRNITSIVGKAISSFLTATASTDSEVKIVTSTTTASSSSSSISSTRRSGENLHRVDNSNDNTDSDEIVSDVDVDGKDRGKQDDDGDDDAKVATKPYLSHINTNINIDYKEKKKPRSELPNPKYSGKKLITDLDLETKTSNSNTIESNEGARDRIGNGKQFNCRKGKKGSITNTANNTNNVDKDKGEDKDNDPATLYSLKKLNPVRKEGIASDKEKLKIKDMAKDKQADFLQVVLKPIKPADTKEKNGEDHKANKANEANTANIVEEKEAKEAPSATRIEAETSDPVGSLNKIKKKLKPVKRKVEETEGYRNSNDVNGKSEPIPLFANAKAALKRTKVMISAEEQQKKDEKLLLAKEEKFAANKMYDISKLKKVERKATHKSSEEKEGKTILLYDIKKLKKLSATTATTTTERGSNVTGTATTAINSKTGKNICSTENTTTLPPPPLPSKPTPLKMPLVRTESKPKEAKKDNLSMASGKRADNVGNEKAKEKEIISGMNGMSVKERAAAIAKKTLTTEGKNNAEALRKTGITAQNQQQTAKTIGSAKVKIVSDNSWRTKSKSKSELTESYDKRASKNVKETSILVSTGAANANRASSLSPSLPPSFSPSSPPLSSKSRIETVENHLPASSTVTVSNPTFLSVKERASMFTSGTLSSVSGTCSDTSQNNNETVMNQLKRQVKTSDGDRLPEKSVSVSSIAQKYLQNAKLSEKKYESESLKTNDEKKPNKASELRDKGKGKAVSTIAQKYLQNAKANNSSTIEIDYHHSNPVTMTEEAKKQLNRKLAVEVETQKEKVTKYDSSTRSNKRRSAAAAPPPTAAAAATAASPVTVITATTKLEPLLTTATSEVVRDDSFLVSPITHISTNTINTPISISHHKKGDFEHELAALPSMSMTENENGNVSDNHVYSMEQNKNDIHIHGNGNKEDSVISCSSAASFSSRFKRHPPNSNSNSNSYLRQHQNQNHSSSSGVKVAAAPFPPATTATATVTPSGKTFSSSRDDKANIHHDDLTHTHYSKMSTFISSSEQFQESLIEEEDEDPTSTSDSTSNPTPISATKASEGVVHEQQQVTTITQHPQNKITVSVPELPVPCMPLSVNTNAEIENKTVISSSSSAFSLKANNIYTYTSGGKHGKDGQTSKFAVHETSERLIEELSGLVPDIMEVNAMAECLGKPISFFLDIKHSPLTEPKMESTAEPIEPTTSRTNLTATATAKTAAATITATNPSSISPSASLSSSSSKVSKVSVSKNPVEDLFLNTMDVTIRATNLTNGSYRFITPTTFQNLLADMRQVYLTQKSLPSSRNANHMSARTSNKLEQLLNGEGTEKEEPCEDIFYIPTNSVTLGVCDIYLHRFLETQVDSIQGIYHFLEPEDGTIMGRLNGMLSISAKYNSPDKPFKVRFVINELYIATDYLLLWGGQGYGKRLRKSSEPSLPLLLEYSFHGQLGCFEIPAQDIQSLPLQIEEGVEMQPIKITFQKEFTVENVQDVGYLFYLSNNALRVKLILEKDPMENKLWSRSANYTPTFPQRFVSASRVVVDKKNKNKNNKKNKSNKNKNKNGNVVGESGVRGISSGPGVNYHENITTFDHFYPSYKDPSHREHKEQVQSANSLYTNTLEKETFVENEYIFDHEVTSRLNSTSTIRRNKKEFYSSHQNQIFLFFNIDIYEPNLDIPNTTFSSSQLEKEPNSVSAMSNSISNREREGERGKNQGSGGVYEDPEPLTFCPVDLKYASKKVISMKKLKSKISSGLVTLGHIASHATYANREDDIFKSILEFDRDRERVGVSAADQADGINNSNKNSTTTNHHTATACHFTHSSVLPSIYEGNEETDANEDDECMSEITAASEIPHTYERDKDQASSHDEQLAFYLSNDPRITQRQIHITIEQVEPLSLLMESIAKVTSSEYMLVEAGEDLSDIDTSASASLSNAKSSNSSADSQQHSLSDSDSQSRRTELNILQVKRDASRRQIKLVVEMPVCHGLYENTDKGLRIALPLQISLYIRGSVVPVTLSQTILMKVCPCEKKKSIFRLMRRNLSNDMDYCSRYSKLGSYLSIQRNMAPDLTPAIKTFVYKKLHSYCEIQRMMMYVASLQGNTNTKLRMRRSLQEERIKEIEEEIFGVGLERTKTSKDYENTNEKRTESENESMTNSKKRQQQEQQQDFSELERESKTSSSIQLALFGIAEPSGRFAKFGKQLSSQNSQPSQERSRKSRSIRESREKQLQSSLPSSSSLHSQSKKKEDKEQCLPKPTTTREIGEAGGKKLYAYLPFIPPDRRPWDYVLKMSTSLLPKMPIERSGYLLKRSGLVGGTWSRFYFVVQRPFLYCYKSHKIATTSPTKFTDIVLITDCTICRGIEEYDIQLKSSPILSQSISSQNNTSKSMTTIKWFLQAANDEDYLQWLFALDPPHFQQILETKRIDL